MWWGLLLLYMGKISDNVSGVWLGVIWKVSVVLLMLRVLLLLMVIFFFGFVF